MDTWLAENDKQKSSQSQTDAEKELAVLKEAIDSSEVEILGVEKKKRVRAKMVKEMLGVLGEALGKKEKDVAKQIGLTLDYKK